VGGCVGGWFGLCIAKYVYKVRGHLTVERHLGIGFIHGMQK
jgi:hypothetical protein